MAPQNQLREGGSLTNPCPKLLPLSPTNTATANHRHISFHIDPPLGPAVSGRLNANPCNGVHPHTSRTLLNLRRGPALSIGFEWNFFGDTEFSCARRDDVDNAKCCSLSFRYHADVCRFISQTWGRLRAFLVACSLGDATGRHCETSVCARPHPTSAV